MHPIDMNLLLGAFISIFSEELFILLCVLGWHLYVGDLIKNLLDTNGVIYLFIYNLNF